MQKTSAAHITRGKAMDSTLGRRRPSLRMDVTPAATKSTVATIISNGTERITIAERYMPNTGVVPLSVSSPMTSEQIKRKR